MSLASASSKPRGGSGRCEPRRLLRGDRQDSCKKTLQSARLLHRPSAFVLQVSGAKPMHTTSPILGIGDAAPDFALMELGADSAQKLSDLRGSTVLVILASAHWDPVKEELAGMYIAGAGTQATIRIVSDGRPEIAGLFCVRDTTGLFVVDEQGVIRWRYLPGVV